MPHSTGTFDTYGSASDVDMFARWVNDVPTGFVVLIAAKDSAGGGPAAEEMAANAQWSSVGSAAIRKIGGASGAKFMMREAYCLCGIKDGDAGREERNPTEQIAELVM